MRGVEARHNPARLRNSGDYGEDLTPNEVEPAKGFEPRKVVT